MNKKEIARLIKVLETQGFSVTKTRKGHWLVRDPEGHVIATLASTPSDTRGFANSVARLRRAGFIWPPKGR
ncbi:hypothetical protein [Spirillospora sp. CA-294931]|uniref:hypothetical protein n=1 Tax=Spirillospora sp. CA-294931 TaxID=3240042 RepID=UPI003D946A58